MAYNQFTLLQIEREFGLQVRREGRLFADVAPVGISARLRQQLAEDTDLALVTGSEKARSEYIIAPILAEVYRQTRDSVTLFSGPQFDVDIPRGLAGYCDFILALAPAVLEIRAPVVAIVEAKRENINAGIPQCLAELIAAQIFNAEQERPIETLYGAITTGEVWKFLRLQSVAATIDTDEYFLNQVEQIVGIFVWMLRMGVS
jgi:hypothetical protein